MVLKRKNLQEIEKILKSPAYEDSSRIEAGVKQNLAVILASEQKHSISLGSKREFRSTRLPEEGSTAGDYKINFSAKNYATYNPAQNDTVLLYGQKMLKER